MYDNANDTAKREVGTKAERPMWTLPHTAYSSTRGIFTTEHEERFGKYGDNPRANLPSNSGSVALLRTENLYFKL